MIIIIIITITALHEAQIRLTYFVYKDTTTELAVVSTLQYKVYILLRCTGIYCKYKHNKSSIKSFYTPTINQFTY